MSLGLRLVLVVFFLAMNAFFVIGEFACVRVRKSQIDLAVEQGRPGAKNALHVTENVNSYLAVVQLGITLASLAIGWLGEPAFAELLEPLIDLTTLPDAISLAIATALGFILMTMIHVIVGEQIPKCLALFNTEAYALWTATPLRWFYRITYPLVWLFTTITNAAVRLMGYDTTQEREAYTDEEIRILVDESTESGLIEEAQNEYVDNVFDLSDRDARSVMTPRTDLVCINSELTLEENMETVLRYKYTRYPMCRGSKDRIVGFVHIKDLFTLPEGSTMDDLPVRPISAAPEGISIPKLIQMLQDNHSKIAVIVDEHGGTEGIVTMSDLMELFVGRTHDEYQHEADEVRKQGEGSFEIEGTLALPELEELMGFLPEEAAEAETAAGLMMVALDRIPTVGDQASFENRHHRATLTVSTMEGHRVERLKLKVEAKPDEDGK